MPTKSLLCCLGTMVLVAACGDAATTDAPPAPARGYQLKTPELPLGAGEEKYLCYTVKLSEPKDVAITKFEAFTKDVVHHYEVFEALAPEKDGLWDCTEQQIKMTWLPLFGGGVGVAGLELPAGAGFKVARDSQLLLQVHLLNATPSPAPSNIVINMTYADDVTKVTPAGIFALGTMGIDLPAGTVGKQLGSQCAAPRPMNVFAVQPHMHKLGTKITFQTGADPASLQVAYKRDPWVFGAQPIDPFTLNLKAGDYIGATCTFDNPTSQPVTYGEKTINEMCYFVMFYTPFDRLGGCID